MSDPATSSPATRRYTYRLLRYSPTPASDEFYNIAALLFDDQNQLIDARFTPDFQRLRCHPAAEPEFLEALREEFEERRLLGEDFAEYVRQLMRHLSTSLSLSDGRARSSAETPVVEMERLVATYLATPPGLRETAPPEETRSGSRGAVRRRMRDAFERAGLFLNGHGLQSEIEVPFGGPQLTFTFDFGYNETESERQGYVHALGARNQVTEATRLCFVYDRLRGAAPTSSPRLDVVLGEEVEEATEALLNDSRIETVAVGEVGALAERLRERLGL